jgi:hypothetical protein
MAVLVLRLVLILAAQLMLAAVEVGLLHLVQLRGLVVLVVAALAH